VGDSTLVSVGATALTPCQGEDVIVMSRWSRRTSAETVDVVIRWPLYLVSSSEILVLLLLVLGQPGERQSGLVVLFAVTVAHGIACVALLRAGIAFFLGGRPPPAPLVGVAAGLTVAGLVAAFAAFPVARAGHGAFEIGIPAGAAALLYCVALTAAATPLLAGWRLVAVVVLPTVVLAVLQVAVGGSRPVWPVNYLLCAGGAAVTYRSSVWALGVLWELDRARGVQARLAVAEERLRFARDLHDVLGRNLTLIAVNSELAAQLVGRSQGEAAEYMRQTRDIAQDSMREMREVVAGRRSTDLDAELAGARSVLRSAGISVRVIGDGSGLPREAQAVLGWVVREATTNILRHSDPTTAKIELGVVQDAAAGSTAVLRIENDGARGPASAEGSGSGLAGLRERLAAHGGDVESEALPGGCFRVYVRLPLTGKSTRSEPVAERAQ
jgi:two-component system sensor histidine kinase DesK